MAVVFAAALIGHVLLLGLLFLLFEVRLGTYEYRDIARNLVGGHGFVLRPGGPPILWRPPLYIYFLAAIYALFGDGMLPVILIQAVLGAITALVVYRIGARLFGEGVGLATAALVTIHPLLWYNAGRVMTETLFTFLLALVVLLLVELTSGDARWAPPALGVLVGLGSLCRATLQFFPLALFAVACWPGAWNRPLAARARQAATVAACCVLVILPWSIRNAVVSGGYVIPIDTSGGYTLWVGTEGATDGLDDDALSPAGLATLQASLARVLGMEGSAKDGRLLERAWSVEGNQVLFRVAIRQIAADPLRSLWLGAKKVWRFWFALMRAENRGLQPWVLVLQAAVLGPAILGAILALRHGRPVLPLFLVIGYLLGLHAAATANVRYSVPVLPYVLMLAAYGVWQVSARRPT